MSRACLFFALLFLTACNDNKISQYKRIVQDADWFELYYRTPARTVMIPPKNIDAFRKAMMRNVRPESEKTFTEDVKVIFTKDGKQTGYLLISTNPKDPFANFHSDHLNFGFKLTYGIGMTIDNLSSQAID